MSKRKKKSKKIVAGIRKKGKKNIQVTWSDCFQFY